jgi:glycosyltransferase involved in cell wall biosynthesis
MKSPLISVILPVYNRMGYLDQAISTVINQTYNNWELLISDDASNLDTQMKLAEYNSNPKIKIHTNHQNIGLFANLNQAIERSEGHYIFLLCSDDFILTNCLEDCLNLLMNNSEAKLALSAFRTVDSNSEESLSGSTYYYDQMISQPVQVLRPCDSLPLLLKYGSINGNLTGVFFNRSLFDQAGKFDEKLKQVADWEWIYRAAKQSPILMSKHPIAFIRSHPEQLSSSNFKNGTNSLEVIDLVGKLLEEPLISKNPNAYRWAKHILQFHLWHSLKFMIKGKWQEFWMIIVAINRVMNLFSVLLFLIMWLPERFRIRFYGGFALPPS